MHALAISTSRACSAAHIITRDVHSMSTKYCKQKFLCPECGSRKPEANSLHHDERKADGAPRGYACANCHLQIPAHLAERWGGISIEEAHSEWLQVYRPEIVGEKVSANL